MLQTIWFLLVVNNSSWSSFKHYASWHNEYLWGRCRLFIIFRQQELQGFDLGLADGFAPFPSFLGLLFLTFLFFRWIDSGIVTKSVQYNKEMSDKKRSAGWQKSDASQYYIQIFETVSMTVSESYNNATTLSAVFNFSLWQVCLVCLVFKCESVLVWCVSDSCVLSVKNSYVFRLHTDFCNSFYDC